MFEFVASLFNKLFFVEKKFRRYLLSNLFTGIAKGFAEIFISIYFWRLEQSFFIIILYFIILRITMLFSFSFIAGPLTKKANPLISFRLGILLSIIFYSMFLILGARSSNYFWILAIINGLSVGTFVLGDHTLKNDFSSYKKRQNDFVSLSGLMMIVKFVAPIAAGFILFKLAYLKPHIAYFPIFALSLIFFIIAFVNSFYFPKYKLKKRQYDLIKCSKLMIKNEKTRVLGYSSFCLGFAYGLLPVVLPLLIYLLSLVETNVGYFEALKVIVSFSMLSFAGKYLSFAKYKKYLFLLGIIIFLIYLIPVFNPSIISIFIFGFLVSLFYPTAEMIWSVIYYNLINVVCKTKKGIEATRVEYIVFQEIWTHSGTIVGLVAMFLIYVYSLNLILSLQVMLGLIGFMMFLWFYCGSLLSKYI